MLNKTPFQQKVSSLKYSKDLARMRRDNLFKAEQRYALALATHSPDLIEARAELQKFVEREDEVIRFRAGVEKGEKVTPCFFNQIQSKRLQSNVTPENRQVPRWNSFKERDYVRAGIPLKE
jgi:hypothetical protein